MTAADTTSALTPPVGDRDHVQGPANAKVTLVEYGDYECPYCGSAHPIVKRLQKEMKGRLRFVFRNFPLREAHPHAMHAALAAEAVAAHDADAFWQMHDTLYEHQDALEDDDLIGYAEAVGVPRAEIIKAFEGGDAESRVRADFRSGVRSGVNGTPTFFVNGERYDGNWTDVRAFLAVLEHAASNNR